MKKLRVIYIMIPLIIIVLVGIYLGIDLDKYRKVPSTALSSENINGISLMEKCNLSLVEKAFGKSEKATFKDSNTEGYSFNSEVCVGAVALNKDDNITSIAFSTKKDTLHTGKGITTNRSSFDDIIKAYGTNYLKVTSKDPERKNNEIGYSITYIDKENNYKLEFDIYKSQSKDKLEYIRLWKYK